MRTAPAFVGARIVDCLTLVTPELARALKAADADGVVQYASVATPESAQGVVDAGLGLSIVTFADQFDGPSAVTALKKLGIPAGADVFLDVEAIAPKLAIEAIEQEINDWAAAVQNAGFVANLYAGVGVSLTSEELYDLAVTGYWKGAGSIRDRMKDLVEPRCGWKMVQGAPTTTLAGVSVDMNMAWRDFEGRPLVWAVT